MNIFTFPVYTLSIFFTGIWLVMGAVDFKMKGYLTSESHSVFYCVIALYVMTGVCQLFTK